MPGLMGVGARYQTDAMKGMSVAADLDAKRDMATKQEKEARDQSQKSSAMTGMGAGAMAGSMIMPGVGTAVGAGIGLLAGWFGSDLF